jgi:hypothetical protein
MFLIFLILKGKNTLHEKLLLKVGGALFCGFALILFARPHQKHDRYEQPEEKQFAFKEQATSLCL